MSSKTPKFLLEYKYRLSYKSYDRSRLRRSRKYCKHRRCSGCCFANTGVAAIVGVSYSKSERDIRCADHVSIKESRSEQYLQTCAPLKNTFNFPFLQRRAIVNLSTRHRQKPPVLTNTYPDPAYISCSLIYQGTER